MNEDYIRLDVAVDSTDKEIEKAYRRKAKEVHPDKNGEKEEFQDLKESYDRIIESRKKENYIMAIEQTISDSFLPMDYMSMGYHNRLNRLNRLNRCNIMKYEEDIINSEITD